MKYGTRYLTTNQYDRDNDKCGNMYQRNYQRGTTVQSGNSLLTKRVFSPLQSQKDSSTAYCLLPTTPNSVSCDAPTSSLGQEWSPPLLVELRLVRLKITTGKKVGDGVAGGSGESEAVALFSSYDTCFLGTGTRLPMSGDPLMFDYMACLRCVSE